MILLLLLLLFPPPRLLPPPIRAAPEWRHTVAPGNEPDPRVDPEYQRRTQRACMREYRRRVSSRRRCRFS